MSAAISGFEESNLAVPDMALRSSGLPMVLLPGKHFFKQRLRALEARVVIQITHGRLKGRELSAASPTRYMSSHRPADENESTSEITTTLGTMSETRVDDVRNIVEPMFRLFDFMQFDAAVYDEIVRNFERGIIR